MPFIQVASSMPNFVADPNSVVRSTGRQIDWDKVSEKRRTTAHIVKLNGAASAGATSITVDALAKKVLSGQLMYFGQSQEFARATADADIGATTISVEALPQALEDNDEAIIGGNGPKVIKAGTLMAEIAATKKIIPREDITGAETAAHLLSETASETPVYGSSSHAKTGYGTYAGGVFYKELLPDQSHANFNTWIGEVNTAGPGVRLETYSDSRAS